MMKLLKYIKKEIALIIFGLILSLGVVFLNIFIPYIIGKSIDLIALMKIDYKKLYFNLNLIVILSISVFILQWLLSILNSFTTNKITKKISMDLFKKIHKLPMKYLDAHQTGEMVSIMVNDVESVGSGLLLGFNQFFVGIMSIMGTVLFMIYINWIIAVVVILVTPLSLFVAKYIANKSYATYLNQSKIKSIQTSYIEESISNLKVIKTYMNEDEYICKFKCINDELKKCSFKATFFSSLTNPTTRFVNSIVYALVALCGAIFLTTNKFVYGLGIGGLACLLSYANQYTKPFNEISSIISELQNSVACSERIFKLLEEKEEDHNLEKVSLNNVQGNISFENVFFGYTDDKILIKNLNLEIKKGSKVAIVGPTGCGKTTLINLLMKFYNIKDGNIRVDNVGINEITTSSLRDSFGMVLQDTWIKYGTVLENVKLGKEDATKEQVIEVCKKSHIHSFIKKLPNGYDTVIDENYNLSQGQKQLLCIARLMLCMPPMLILDEATSSIDTNTEKQIQDAFNKIMEGKTSFIVAHRLSTIKEADIILVMKDGNIVEKGTHQELLQLNGFYSEIYHSQFIKNK